MLSVTQRGRATNANQGQWQENFPEAYNKILNSMTIITSPRNERITKKGEMKRDPGGHRDFACAPPPVLASAMNKHVFLQMRT